MSPLAAIPLLPSREKVPAQPADEGAFPERARPPGPHYLRHRPLIRPSGTFSREGRRPTAPDTVHP
ncbi:protein of unknown function [Beijerinckiaceae bacterium RH AL1]|nr:protein of unknown function [Beijerinckiaceae bacterium RH CH11]VVB48710.1 protein of unknown function [Beijerinckiaceae bacterium RH AL8]VVC56490.1 protein of unknown function [Beijerinckiaceae bacterium RH AL1]